MILVVETNAQHNNKGIIYQTIARINYTLIDMFIADTCNHFIGNKYVNNTLNSHNYLFFPFTTEIG